MDDKIKILIASVLKPADDVRSCYKIGQSLAQTNKYEVNIIGFDSKKKYHSENIFLYPIFNFKRNSIKRLFAPFSIFKKYIELKPKLLIANSPELLWVMYLIKILFGTKIIYDIQENYQFNIEQNQIYKGLSKYILKNYIKLNENLSKYFVDGYFLAEEIYETQLKFIQRKPFIKLLNKTILNLNTDLKPIKFHKEQPLNFIYSGTIGKEYGTLETINFCKKLHEEKANICLNIVGYSSDKEYLMKIIESAKNFEFIRIITDNKPIAHSEIVAEIRKADIALLPYQLNPNIKSRFPTKIYDYLALKTPMIIPQHPKWKAFLDQYNAGIMVDYQKSEVKTTLEQLSSTEFYNNNPKAEIQWKSQEKELVNFIRKILSK
ncbi:glycosyltransferase [Marivirga sp.]|uniref:glycosyltransferase n=1 Tax=Marivirga sp. TaxID=2018662 RepID=UPI003DA77D95